MPDMGGKLNKLIATKTKEILESKGYKVTLNDITQKYDPKNEVKKIVDNDCIIFQYHIWWFNIPWELKNGYILCLWWFKEFYEQMMKEQVLIQIKNICYQQLEMNL